MLDRSDVWRRVRKSIHLHLGSLENLFTNEVDSPVLASFQFRDRALLQRIRQKRYDVFGFVEVCQQIDSSVSQLPLVFILAFVARAVDCRSRRPIVFRDEDFSRGKAETITRDAIATIRRLLGSYVDEDIGGEVVESSIKLFALWDAMIPATLAYDNEQMPAVKATWVEEVTIGGLVPPHSHKTAFFEDASDWVPIAAELTGTPLPSFLALLARSYNVALLNCVVINF